MSEKHVGFTGTRDGMTDAQVARVARILSSLQGWLHHGDCVGSDEKAHNLARGFGIRVVVHPPANPNLRAYCKGDEERDPKDYLARDREIVDETVGLIAAPRGFTEEQRSGTWATIRYARRTGKPHIIVYPDGRQDNVRARERGQ